MSIIKLLIIIRISNFNAAPFSNGYKFIHNAFSPAAPAAAEDLKKHEDLGRVAELSRCSMKQLFKPPVLTVQSVFNVLKSLSEITGKKSQEQKRASVRITAATAAHSSSISNTYTTRRNF